MKRSLKVPFLFVWLSELDVFRTKFPCLNVNDLVHRLQIIPNPKPTELSRLAWASVEVSVVVNEIIDEKGILWELIN